LSEHLQWLPATCSGGCLARRPIRRCEEELGRRRRALVLASSVAPSASLASPAGKLSLEARVAATAATLAVQ
jgi:hypothetical protein